ncbi:MAG: homocysteine S-methyltransferase family protein [Polyangiaceae bacterium]
MITILDGPVGSLLPELSVATPAPLWSAAAIEGAPEVLRRVHTMYTSAGASVHTACTFRTNRRKAGPAWERLTREAVRIAREAVPEGQRVAGSLAPVEDCYRPDLSPADPRPEHREMARALAAAGVDLILCETFPHVGEAWVAVEEAVASGLPVWASFTAGPDATLLSPEDMESAARGAVARGAVAVMVNCTAASRTLPYVQALAAALPAGVPFGAYANAGGAGDWNAQDAEAVERYMACARAWVQAGATLVGSCCGTGPAHIAELAREFGG